MPMVTEPTCDTCRFFVIHTRFDPELRAHVNLKSGDCRRGAPRARLDRKGEAIAGYWPHVTRQHFCGEWRRERRLDGPDDQHVDATEGAAS